VLMSWRPVTSNLYELAPSTSSWRWPRRAVVAAMAFPHNAISDASASRIVYHVLANIQVSQGMIFNLSQIHFLLSPSGPGAKHPQAPHGSTSIMFPSESHTRGCPE